MHYIKLHTIKLATTVDGRDWNCNARGYHFTTRAKAKAALRKEIEHSKKIGEFIELEKDGFESRWAKMWLEETTIKIEA